MESSYFCDLILHHFVLVKGATRFGSVAVAAVVEMYGNLHLFQNSGLFQN